MSVSFLTKKSLRRKDRNNDSYKVIFNSYLSNPIQMYVKNRIIFWVHICTINRYFVIFLISSHSNHNELANELCHSPNICLSIALVFDFHVIVPVYCIFKSHLT